MTLKDLKEFIFLYNHHKGFFRKIFLDKEAVRSLKSFVSYQIRIDSATDSTIITYQNFLGYINDQGLNLNLRDQFTFKESIADLFFDEWRASRFRDIVPGIQMSSVNTSQSLNLEVKTANEQPNTTLTPSPFGRSSVFFVSKFKLEPNDFPSDIPSHALEKKY